MKKEEITLELGSATTQLKLLAADGKKYKTDMLDSEGIIELSKNFPNNKATKFLNWFLYSNLALMDKARRRRTACLKGIDYSYYYEE